MKIDFEIVEIKSTDIVTTGSIEACMVPGQFIEECDTDEE